MGQDGNRKALAALVAELKTKCQNGASGKVYVTTNTNSFAQFGLKEGQIVAITYGNKKGIEALNALGEIESVSPVFMPMATYNDAVMALPSNDDIFNQLLSAHASSAAVSMEPVSQPQPIAGLPQDIQDVLRQTLANYIGPMAAPVCSQVLPSVSDIDAAIAALAAKIPDPERAEAFQAEAFKRF